MTQQTLKPFTEELEARSKPIDTLQLQLQSLYNFAGKLGYQFRGSYYQNEGFANHDAPRESLKYISFNTMKYWHDNPFNNYSFTDKMNLADAANSRLVAKLKIQRTADGIKVQDHYVKVITNSAEEYKKTKLKQACPSLTLEQLETIVESGIIK